MPTTFAILDLRKAIWFTNAWSSQFLLTWCVLFIHSFFASLCKYIVTSDWKLHGIDIWDSNNLQFILVTMIENMSWKSLKGAYHNHSSKIKSKIFGSMCYRVLLLYMKFQANIFHNTSILSIIRLVQLLHYVFYFFLVLKICPYNLIWSFSSLVFFFFGFPFWHHSYIFPFI